MSDANGREALSGPNAPRVTIGMFAHNEERKIASMIARLAQQDFTGLNVDVVILGNGCVDRTVEIARQALAGIDPRLVGSSVVDLPSIGKSGTWNQFVHELSPKESEVLIFLDSDIEFARDRSILDLVQLLRDRPHAHCSVSAPIKRVDLEGGLFARLAARGPATYDAGSSICGQLWAARSEAVRRFRLPLGLPVEDGFCRAMMVTNLFTGVRDSDDLGRVAADPGIFHYFEPEPTLRGWYRHERRLLAASAVNLLIYDLLWSRVVPGTDAGQVMRSFEAESPRWLRDLVRSRVESKLWMVPTEYLTRRFRHVGPVRVSLRSTPKRLVMSVLDWIAAIGANRMLRRPPGPKGDSWMQFLG